MAKNTPSKQLFDLLVTRNFDPELRNSAGKPVTDPGEAEVLSFDFITESGKDYGSVVIMLGDENVLEVFFGDNVGRSMEGVDKNEWYSFLEQLKHFSTKNLLNFGLKNINRLKYSMQGQAAIKEGLFESWHGSKHVSYNDRPESVRLMIKHKRAIGEGDARYRYIESLFLETSDGERFKLPFTKLSGGRAMCEHVRAGGRPYDSRGQHIAAIVEELNVLSRFKRANAGKVFEGETAKLINETNAYHENLNRVLKGLGSHRGYSNYFETWNPSEVTEADVIIENIKTMFVRRDIDHRIEEALPILARIQQQGNDMKEAQIFESWVNRLVEGTWATPDTPEKKQKLVDLLSTELPVGADATNATEQLYDLLGDDVLFDQLEELADVDANADARQTVFLRMQEISDDRDVAEVLGRLTIDTDASMEPAEPDQEVDELNEMLPALGAAVGRALVGAGAGALERGAASLAGHALGGEIEDALSGDEELDEAVGSFFVVYDDGRKPFGPMSEDQARATVAKYKEGKVIPATQLSAWQQANRDEAMKGSKTMEADNLSTFEEGQCNYTMEGESCPVHGMNECYSLMAAPVAESQNTEFLSRLKTLSGILAR
jgi:hypothetical protein